jgi:NAD(P)-dependent dehydrogenase (short-subunit alcohol dehydrogenase family)
MTGRLEGKVCAVTGAARGIGRAVALAYAAEGATVYALDRLAGELPEGPGLRPRALDVTDAEAVAATFAAIEAEAGGVDVLVNNAGIIFFKPIEETSVADWDGLMAVNLRGPSCARAPWRVA